MIPAERDGFVDWENIFRPTLRGGEAFLGLLAKIKCRSCVALKHGPGAPHPNGKPKIALIQELVEMEIDLSKITLRPYKISDADDFLMYGGDDRVTRFTRWNTFTSKEESVAYINDYCIPHPYCRSICTADRSIGFIIVVPGSGDDRCRADVGYALAAEYWGKGITARAVKMAIAEVLKEFPEVVRFQALVELQNKASQRVLEKLGFLREGVMRKYIFNKGKSRDTVMYSLLSTDPNIP